MHTSSDNAIDAGYNGFRKLALSIFDRYAHIFSSEALDSCVREMSIVASSFLNIRCRHCA
jgi:hypothetical protein